MSYTIQLLAADDYAVLTHVAPDVFDHPVHAGWSTSFLADPRHHLVVAMDAGVVVGMASGVHYVHPDKPPELWVNEVGVAFAYRQQGVGAALLDALFVHARTLGCTEAWVLTDEKNTAARRLYARVGGVEAEGKPVYVTFSL